MGGIVAGVFDVLVGLVFPLGVLLYLILRRPRLVKPFLLGAATFLVFQVLTRIPLLQLAVQKTAWFAALRLLHPVLTMLLLSFTAGLFEECGRYVVMRRFMKQRLTYADGVAFGLGHGGLEAAMLGVTYLQRLFFQTAYLALLPASEIALAGVERIFAMTAHVGLSLVVLAAVRDKKPALLPLAVGLHTAFNFVPLLAMQYTGSLLLTEGIIALFAAGFLAYILRTKPKHTPPQEEVPS